MVDVYAKFGLEPGTQDFIGNITVIQNNYMTLNYIKQVMPWHFTWTINISLNLLVKLLKRLFFMLLLWLVTVKVLTSTPSMVQVNSPNLLLGKVYHYHFFQKEASISSDSPNSNSSLLNSRLSAIYGGTYMLDRAADEILYENGVAVGIRSGSETAKAKQIICDPSYAKDKVEATGKVVRAICFLKHPIPNTTEADSVQIVIPQNELGRKHDVYVASVSSNHAVCPKDMYLAIVSTIVETEDPESEIKAGLDVLGPIHDKFVHVSAIEEPTSDGKAEQVFVSKSYDATSHFETVCDDVKSIYRRMTGSDLVLRKRSENDHIEA